MPGSNPRPDGPIRQGNNHSTADHGAGDLRRSEIRYRRLFEAARDGILILDPVTRRIVDANPFMTELLGYSKKQLFRKELWQIGLLKDGEASRRAFRKLERTGYIRYENLPLKTKGGLQREVEFVSNRYVEDGSPVIQCNIRDITGRAREKEALLASEARFRALFKLEPVGIYSCDAMGALLEFNHCAERLWGRKPRLRNRAQRFCGSFRMHHPDGTPMPLNDCPMARVLSGEIPTARNLEAVIQRPDGSRITVVVNIVPLRDSDGRVSGAINCFYDVSELKEIEKRLTDSKKQLALHAGQLQTTVAERTATLISTNRRLSDSVRSNREGRDEYRKLFLASQRMQEKLKRLSHEILSAQEEERKKISRDLHDAVVQTLAGISIDLTALGTGAGIDPLAVKWRIARAQRLVASSADAVHRFARELRPAALDDLGLIPALQAYIRNLSGQKTTKIRLTDFGGVEELESDKRTVLYRVAQEALTNVIRHAKATEVTMSVRRLAASIQLEIADNGRSFDVDKILLARNNRRLGLIGMRERVQMVGGNLTIESLRGRGTTVRAQVPFTELKA